MDAVSGLGGILGALINVPTSLIKYIVSAAIMAILLGCTWFVLAVGHPRTFWTHHSMDLDAYARESAKRMVRRAREVNDALTHHPSDSLMNKLLVAYPSLRAFAASALDGTEHAYETVDRVRDGILGIGSGGPLLKSARELLFGRPVNEVAGDYATRGAPAVQRAACAVSDVRFLCASVFPKVASMYDVRTRKMTLPQTVLYHTREDGQAFIANVRAAFNIRADKREEEIVEAMFGSANAFADVMMTGQSREHFFKSLRSIVKIVPGILKVIPMLLKLIPEVIKMVPTVLKLLPMILSLVQPLVQLALSILQILLESLDDILDLLRSFVLSLAFIAKQLKRGPVYALIAILRVLLGLALKIALILLRTIIRVALVYILKYWFPVVSTLWLSLVFVVIVLLKSAVAFADYMSNGMMRFVSRTDQHPEAWWKQASFERSNKHTRNIFSWRPCPPSYQVSPTGVFCESGNLGVPAYSPAALIMRYYVTGSYRCWGSRLPNRDVTSQEMYNRLKTREFPSVLAGDSNKPARELMVMLATCYADALSPASTMRELVHHTGLVGTDSSYSLKNLDSAGLPLGMKLVFASTSIAFFGIGARVIAGL